MHTNKFFRSLILVAFMLCITAAAQAATYGYIVVRGKNLDFINREIDTIERLINTWKNGEVLYKHTVTSGGAFFFKRVTATVFFAGNRSDISTFLTSGPYEGDYLRDIVIKFNYRSLRTKNAFDGDINTTFTRKYTNIRKAVEEIQGKKSSILWQDLKNKRPRDYGKHVVSNEIINPTVSIVYYSVQPVEDNRLFGISYTPDSVVTEK